jgi:hypothetical protein
MSEIINPEIPNLPPSGAPQNGMLLVVYNPVTGLAEKMLIDFFVPAATQDFTYNPEFVYGLNAFVTFGGFGYTSDSADNQGNEPSAGSAFWTQINLSASGLVYWAAGAFTQEKVVLLNDISGVTEFYELINTDRPFISSDFAAELAGGDWRQMTGIGGADTFGADFTVVLSGGKTFGKYSNGQLVPAAGKTPRQVILDVAIEYLLPAFTSFGITGQAATIELGASIAAGAKVFTWATSNDDNVEPDTIEIRDQSAGIDLAVGLADDGTQNINLPGPIQLVNEGNTQIFRITGENTNGDPFTRDFTITADFLRFYGVSPVAPDVSAEVRALPFSTFGNTFSIPIPQGETIICFAYEAARPDISDSSVKYVEGFNANVGNTFTKFTFNVNDGGGTARSYKVYIATLGAPLPSDATYNVTIP